MVGVAGKSKGCSTCKKRKIKCDLRRPSCGQCIGSKRDCGGYLRPTVFRNHFIDQSHREGPYLGQNVVDTPQIRREVGVLAKDRSELSLIPCHDFWINPITSYPSLSTLIDFCLPKNVAEEVPLSWLHSLETLNQKNDGLRLAILTLAAGWIGHTEDQIQLVMQSREHYGKALRSLRDVIVSAESSLREETLAAMDLLLLYELYEFGIEKYEGWSLHLNGIETILLLRGPQPHTAGSSQQMFLFSRTLSVLKALTFRKMTFLADSEWKHTPWMLHKKSAFHNFLDIAVEVPYLLELADKMVSNPVRMSVSRISNLQSKAIELTQRFQQWEKTAGLRLPLLPFNSKRLSAASVKRTHCYPKNMAKSNDELFDILQSARLLLFYWATLLTLITTNETLSRTCESVSTDQLWIPPGRDSCCPNILADNITNWVAYCAQSTWQSFGPAIAIFSLKAAIKWYSGEIALHPWCQSQIEQNLGFCRELLNVLVNVEGSNEV